MSSLLTALLVSFVTIVIAFWLLYFFVVKVRIADRRLPVQEDSRLGFLLTRWPHEEMRAYLADLDPSERRGPINWFLARANVISGALLAAYI